MFYSVDRIENSLVVLIGDNGEKKHIERPLFSFTVKEGDMLRFKDGSWTIDCEETERRRAEARSLLDSLLK